MTTINIKSAGKKIKLNGLKARELGLIVKRFNSVRERAESDKKVGDALNGFIFLLKREKLEPMSIMMFLPQVLDVLWDELKALYMDLFSLTEEEFDNLELEEIVELFIGFVSTVDINKITNLLGKYTIQPSK